MFTKTLLGFSSHVSLVVASLALAACSSAPTSEATGHSGQAATVADPQFTACLTDDDCVAVPLAGCCHNGWLVAVSGCQAADYASANACTVQNVACPLYVVNDTRVAVCDQSSSSCTLVQPATTVTADDAGTAPGDDAGNGTPVSN